MCHFHIILLHADERNFETLRSALLCKKTLIFFLKKKKLCLLCREKLFSINSFNISKDAQMNVGNANDNIYFSYYVLLHNSVDIQLNSLSFKRVNY